MDLESLFNNLITSGITFSSPGRNREIKILNSFHLVFVMLAPLLGLFYFYVGAIQLFYASIVAGLLMIGSLILLRKTINVSLVGNIAILILWATLSFITWNTGAITSEGVIRPSWMLNAGLILMAIFFNGYLWGTIWATVLFVETGLVFYLFRSGYHFPNLIPAEISGTYSLGSYLLSFLAILTFAFLFEREKSEAQSREREKTQAVKKSKKYIDEILARSPVPTFILDKNHRVIQWNQACQEMTGLRPEEILGKGVWEGFFADDEGSMADALLRDPEIIAEKYAKSIISRQATGLFELEMFMPKMKGGLRAIVTVAPILDSSGTVRGAIQTIQEIKSVFPRGDLAKDGGIGLMEDSLVHPIFKIDSEGKISFWNRACEEKLGYTSAQMIGKNPLVFVSKRHRSGFQKMVSVVLKGDSIIDKEWKYYDKERNSLYVLTEAYPLKASDGKGSECLVVNTNITPLKLRMRKLELYAVESKEKLKNLSEDYNLLKKNIATFIRKKDG